MEAHNRKEALISELLFSIDTAVWEFEKSIDDKARSHLEILLLDHWPRNHSEPQGTMLDESLEIPDDETSSHSDNGSAAKFVPENEMLTQLATAVQSCYKDLTAEYNRWCYISKQRSAIANDGSTSNRDKIRSLLLLLMVYGAIDIIRAQNHVCLMLFHAAKVQDNIQVALAPMMVIPRRRIVELENNQVHSSSTQNDNTESEISEKDNDNPVVDNCSVHVELPDVEANTRKKYRQTQTVPPIGEQAETEEKSVGMTVVFLARRLYNLMETMIDTGKFNQEYFDWDDLNDLCWTSKFVKRFLYAKHKQFAPEVDRPFNLQKDFKVIWSKLNGELENVEVDQADEVIRKLEKQKKKFSHKFKTYFDKSGGFLGWSGYVTSFFRFSQATYFQLLALVVVLIWMFDFRMNNYYYAAVCGVPLVPIVAIVLVKLLVSFRTDPSVLNPYKIYIPRRDARKQNFIASRARKFFRPRQIMILIMLAVLFVMDVCLGYAVVYVALKKPAKEFEILTYQIFQSANGYTTASGVIDYTIIVEYSLVAAALLALCIAVLAIYLIIPPVCFQILLSIIGYLHGRRLGVGRVKTWANLRSKFFQGKTIYKRFRTKVLAQDFDQKEELSSEEMRKIEWQFATLWNATIQDFYDSHMCSEQEATSLSYVIRTDRSMTGEGQYAIHKRPDLAKEPKSKVMSYHLVKFINNLCMGSMPSGPGVKIMDMKRIVLFTPVFKEKILYSWEELVKPHDTETSFLRTLILKFSDEWHNMKEKEFPSGNRLRNTIDYIESKVMAGIDITTHEIHKQTTMEFMKDMICSWASLRFQPVSRCVHGFLRVPKAIALLLRLQNPELTEEEIRHITRQKFSFIVGSQLHDKAAWNAIHKYEFLEDEGKRACDSEYENHIRGFKKICQWGDSMVRIAHLKHDDKIDTWTANLTTWDEAEKRFDTVYSIDTFGDFTVMGQGKPANLAFMSQFFDGSHAQTVDCNMDNAITQSFFLPNALQEFENNSKVKIVGCPSFSLLHKWSAAGYASAFNERIFGSIFQRVYSVIGQRLHYGHSDIIHGTWMMFTTGLHKMSDVSEGLCTGIDTIVNGGKSILVDYYEVGKARDVAVLPTTKYNRKRAAAAAELSTSRYPNILMTSRHFSMLDKIMFCYTIVGQYTQAWQTITSMFVLHFCRCFMMMMTIILASMASNDIAPTVASSVISLQTANVSATYALMVTQAIAFMSLPGLMLLLLEDGIISGIFNYVIHFFVNVFIYNVVHTLNTAFYYHFGFCAPARHKLTGRSHSLNHISILDMFSSFEVTHFYPVGFLTILYVIQAGLGGLAVLETLSYQILMMVLIIWGPFAYNSGAFPTSTTYSNWKKLYAEDHHRIKTWRKHLCPIGHVEELIENDKLYKQLKLEYRSLIQGDDDLESLELDLELCILADDPERTKPTNYYNIKNKDRAYSLTTLKEQLRRRKLQKEESYNRALELEPDNDHSIMDRYNRAVRRNCCEAIILSFLRLTAKPFRKLGQVLSRVPILGENIYLLIILTGTKYIAYLLFLWKMIMPWSSPPDYRHVYTDNYMQRTTESRIINIQRLIRSMYLQNYLNDSRAESSVGLGSTTGSVRTPTRYSTMGVITRMKDTNMNATQTGGSVMTPSSTRVSLRGSQQIAPGFRAESTMSPSNFRRMFPLRSKFSASTPASVLGATPVGSARTPIGGSQRFSSRVVSPIAEKKPRLLQTTTRNESPVSSKMLSPNTRPSMELVQRPTTPVKELTPIILSRGLSNDNRELLGSMRTRRPKAYTAMMDFLLAVKSDQRGGINRGKQINELFKTAGREMENSMHLNSDALSIIAAQCMEEMSLLKEANTAADKDVFDMVDAMVLYDLFKYYKLFHKNTKRSVGRVNKIIDPKKKKRSSVSRSTFSQSQREKTIIDPETDQLNRTNKFRNAARLLKDAAHYMYVEHNTPFERIMYEPNCPERSYIRNRVLHLCKMIAEESFSLANAFLLEAKRQFKHFNASVQQIDIFGHNPSKCPTCLVKEKRLQVVKNAQTTLSQALNFVERLVEVDPTNSVYSGLVMRNGAQISFGVEEENFEKEERRKMMIVDDDNGQCFIDQCFPVVEAVTLVNLQEEAPTLKNTPLMWDGEQANQVALEKEAMMEDLMRVLRDAMDKPFMGLCDDCAEMLEYLKKQERVIRNSHQHNDNDIQDVSIPIN